MEIEKKRLKGRGSAEVRCGEYSRIIKYSILRENYGIISTDIIRAEVRIGYHILSRSDYGIISKTITAQKEVSP